MSIETGLLISILVSLYIVYKFWKKILKTLLIVLVLSFTFLVIKVKSVYDDLVSENKIELPKETTINEKQLTKLLESHLFVSSHNIMFPCLEKQGGGI
jgi:hypothetical protein